jgi:hypothetical protein
MSANEMRRARRERLAKKQAATIVQEATERIVAKRTPSPPSSPQDQAVEVKRLRDEEKVAWWVIGQRLGLVGEASSASDPEAKRGAGAARRLYAAASNGVVPRSHAPRKGSVPRVVTPGNSGTVTSRKEKLVNEGHVIPRDMPDEEVEALLVGRGIEWAIDMAALTETDPDTWGSEDSRWIKQDAKVHVLPDNVWVGEIEGTEGRVVKFREYGGYDTDRRKHMSGPTRVVRVDSIYTIR